MYKSAIKVDWCEYDHVDNLLGCEHSCVYHHLTQHLNREIHGVCTWDQLPWDQLSQDQLPRDQLSWDQLQVQVMGISFDPLVVVSDFELAMVQASTMRFPNSYHRGCYYHFMQAIWRKVYAHKYDVTNPMCCVEIVINFTGIILINISPERTTMLRDDFQGWRKSSANLTQTSIHGPNTSKERRQWLRPRFRASGLELQLGHGYTLYEREVEEDTDSLWPLQHRRLDFERISSSHQEAPY